MVIQMYVSENFEFKFSRVKSHLKDAGVCLLCQESGEESSLKHGKVKVRHINRQMAEF